MTVLLPIHNREIEDLMGGRVQFKAPLSRYTSFRIGGPADILAEPDSVPRLASLLRYLNERNIPYVLLGSGTNVLFQDAGFRGVVIRTVSIGGFDIELNCGDHARITAGAGVPLPFMIGRAARLGWKGLEPLWGIPGSFGGALVTNAGAGGVSIGDLTLNVTLVDQYGEQLTMEKNDLCFGYRSAKLPEAAVVVQGTLRLNRGDAQSIDAELQRARQRRHSSQPYDRPSAGCVFKNPSPGNPAGAIIDRLGFKGVSVGEAQVSEIHANFIINRGKACSSDVLALIERIRARARQEENVELELEIRVIGEEPPHV